MRNRHHLWWPRRDYRTATEREFRTLPCNVIRIDPDIHLLIHLFCEPPRKPEVAHMKGAIFRHLNRCCGCSKEVSDG